MQAVYDEEPEDFDQQPKYFVLLVHASQTMEVEILNAFFAFSAMVFFRIL